MSFPFLKITLINFFRCEYSTSIKSNIEHHIKSHLKLESQVFFCEMCGLEYKKRHLLNRHVKNKHFKKERQYECPNQECDKGEHFLRVFKKIFNYYF